MGTTWNKISTSAAGVINASMNRVFSFIGRELPTNQRGRLRSVYLLRRLRVTSREACNALSSRVPPRSSLPAGGEGRCGSGRDTKGEAPQFPVAARRILSACSASTFGMSSRLPESAAIAMSE